MSCETRNSWYRRDLARRSVLLGSASAALLPVLGITRLRAGNGYAVEIAPGAFVHKGQHALFTPQNAGDISNPGFVVGDDAVAVIDTGGSPRIGESLLAAVREVTPKPVRYVITTHMHPDHVFGNAAFKADGVTFAGHHKLARGLSARAERYLAINKERLGEAAFSGTEIILPTLTVQDRTTLDLGNRPLELVARPTAHTDNDLTVFDVATGSMYMGDLLFAEHIPTIDGSIKGWIALLDRLAGDPYKRVVPGHGPTSLAWPAGGDPLRRYLNAVATDVRRLIKEGRTMEVATATAALSEKGAWLLADEYHARNVSAAFAELEWE